MNAKTLAVLLKGSLLTKNGENDINSGFACDLMSYALANAREGCAWITVHTHMNVAAVAALNRIACIVWPKGAETDAETAKKAEEQGIAVIKTELSAYQPAGIMYLKGIK